MKTLSFEKIFNIVFIVIITILFSFPYIFAHRYARNNDNTSLEENRNLEPPTAILNGASLNMGFPSEYDRWFKDHLGLRNTLININACIDYYVFNQFPDSTNRAINKTGVMSDGEYASQQSYAHTNLLSDEQLIELGNSYQKINDWLCNQDIQFYFVQNVEKYEIYPESYLTGICQIGDISKQDQIVNYLRNYTTVPCIYTKDALLENRNTYKIYNDWSDFAHWSPRGAYIGYLELMNTMNDYGNNLKVLSESDYKISIVDAGEHVYNYLYQEDIREEFNLINPQSIRSNLTDIISVETGFNLRNVYENPSLEDGKKVLIFDDSYFYMFIIDDIAESFAVTWDLSHSELINLPDIINIYKPDIVILEIAQRSDSYTYVINLSNTLN